MNTTEIIAPDGTLLLTDRIPKSAVYVVLQDGWSCEGYDAGRWGVMSTHRTWPCQSCMGRLEGIPNSTGGES